MKEPFTTSVKSSIRAAGVIQLLIYCMLNAISFGGIVFGMILLASTGSIIPIKNISSDICNAAITNLQ